MTADRHDVLDPFGHLDPWDRQPGETAKAYSYFAAYRDAGPSRSIRNLAEQRGRARQYLYQLSHDHRWAQRAEQHDRANDQAFRRRMAARRQQVAEQHIAVAGALLTQAVLGLKALKVEDLSPADLARFVDVAVKVQRVALGDVAAPGDRESALVAAHDLTDEQAAQRLRDLRAEIERRLEPVDGGT